MAPIAQANSQNFLNLSESGFTVFQGAFPAEMRSCRCHLRSSDVTTGRGLGLGAARTERASLDMRAATCLLRGAVSIRQSLRSCPAARSVQRSRRPSVRTAWTSASSSSAPDVSDGHTSSNKSPASDKSVMFVSFLWPEASSSAAGVRTGSLLRAFQSWGWRVHFVACAKPNRHAESLSASGVVTHHVPPNRGAEFEAALAAANPDAVVFDRFMAEEAFSFRVRAACPKAARRVDASGDARARPAPRLRQRLSPKTPNAG